MKEDSAEVTRDGEGDRKPKMERAGSDMVLESQTGQEMEDPNHSLLRLSVVPQPEILEVVMSSDQSINLSLSLTPPKKGKAVLDLHAEPSEEEVSTVIYPVQDEKPKYLTGCSSLPLFTDLHPSTPADRYHLTKDNPIQANLPSLSHPKSFTTFAHSMPTHPYPTENNSKPYLTFESSVSTIFPILSPQNVSNVPYLQLGPCLT